MSGKLTTLIIDDEPPARALLSHYLQQIDMVQVVGECANGFEALKAIQEVQPDLILLDIQMPRINGFELLEVLNSKPEVIFCTAYDAYALRAFEMHAVDYLLKPFSQERLAEAIGRAAERISVKAGAPEGVTRLISEQGAKQMADGGRIIAKTGTTITVIPFESIDYLEAQDDYVLVVSDHGNHLKEKTMKYYEEHLPPDLFLRIHRSYIVNIRKIKSIFLYGKESYKVKLLSGAEIRASAAGYKMLKEML
jgi:two-component system, LytTR family, response regulator